MKLLRKNITCNLFEIKWHMSETDKKEDGSQLTQHQKQEEEEEHNNNQEKEEEQEARWATVRKRRSMKSFNSSSATPQPFWKREL